MKEKQTPKTNEERPPLFRTWPQVYVFVLAVLLAIIIFLGAFTQHFQ